MYKATTHLWQSKGPLFKLTVLGSAFVALGISGCSSTPSSSSSQKIQQTQMLGANGMDGLEDLLSATDMRAVEGDRLLVLKHGDVWKRMLVGFDMDLSRRDSRIEAQRGWFISRQPYIDRLSARASRYLYHTVKEAERRGLPTELALLPIIESSYDPAATSSAAAAGLWQFIPSTGKIYGLKQTSQYDGRRDVVESTRAAYEFLGSLYNQFGSWELALASYNAGPGRIQQAINRNKAAGLPTDYWSLKLPQETMYYVPRFLAVAQIIKNPSAYNVTLPSIANRPHFREIQVGPVALNDIARITGLSRAELYQLNPGHRGEYVDASSPMRILIPADLSPTIDARLKTLHGGQANLVASAPSTTPSGSFKPVTPTKAAPPPIITSSQTVTQSTTTTRPSATTPKGSAALAAFASNMDVPSAPRIPVAVTPAANVQPVRTEPALSAAEREKVLAALALEEQAQVAAASQPVASQAEQAQVVAELKQITPQGTEIVDPVDGKIKLTALQTSQSIAEQSGQELKKGFSYPKGVADNTSPTSEEAKLNQGKNVIRTASDIVVVPPKGKRSTYVVMPGDNLQMIAMKNGVNWRDVANWNQIDPNAVLYVGTTIYLYDAKPVAATPEAVKPKSVPYVYTVRANDTLSGIAAEYGLSLKQLADYNNLTVTSGIFSGQKLQLKDNPQAKKVEVEQPSASKIKTKSYTVQRGEYLAVLADRYALSNQALADLTVGLTANSQLMAGQKINVPLTEAVANTTPSVAQDKVDSKALKPNIKLEAYTVKRGDSLYSIASQAKLSVAELAALNDMAANQSLYAGQTLQVPLGYQVPEQYTVQAGDTLTGIANRYDLSMDEIANWNGLGRNSGLRAGQRLSLSPEAEKSTPVAPAKAKTNNTSKMPEVYVVKSGDNLTSIAAKYHLQVSYLMQLNDLTSSIVRVGQRLKLDGELEAKAEQKVEKTAAPISNKTVIKNSRTETYTVKSGESLYAIAKRLEMSSSELASLNNLSSNASLRVGQSIHIPKKFTDYRVKSGDTLIGLASRYGLAQNALAELNDLTPNTQLRIGQVIQVPNL
ncbi:LysM peptidoglycan-binding domain-containing protein [uncultured Acinetobacter sp.]|uniref:LysM peptidoglycan-binding domain-containing protein n=1 Tax=uncultured Acinetobacter sp. TaxID=165433 RepID=UPI00261C87C1|nr:LysM peptidoglycan-binding domain-containing protein [uncultured Acinetobacter sp.]